MAMAILIDEFDGDPQELYGMVTEEIKKREIPGVKFGSTTEIRSKGWFSGPEMAPTLAVVDGTHRMLVFAYQFGRSFHVSTRAYWEKVKMAEKERVGKLAFLEDVRSGCFSETVDRAVRAALTKHLEKRQAPIPSALNPKEIFYRREAQTGEAEG